MVLFRRPVLLLVPEIQEAADVLQDRGKVGTDADDRVGFLRGASDGHGQEIEMEVEEPRASLDVQQDAIRGEADATTGTLRLGDHVEEAGMKKRLAPALEVDVLRLAEEGGKTLECHPGKIQS